MQSIKVCGLTMARKVKIVPSRECLPFRLKRAFCLDRVQGDHAKSTCTRVISSLEVVSPLLCRAQLDNCAVNFKDGQSRCLSNCSSCVGSDTICGSDASEWFDKRLF